MINRLWLHNFRNYSNQEIAFKSNIVAFVGANGQGKSNLIEAIFFVSMLRSFITTRIADIKKIGSLGFYLGIEYSGDSWERKLEIDYSDEVTRKLLIDNQPVNRSSDFIRRIKSVVFAPDDINIVTGQSGLRRRFIDMLISVNEPGYMNALHNYNKALRSRNAVLRNNSYDTKLIMAFEPVLAELSSFIINRRLEYAEFIEQEVIELLTHFYKGAGLFNFIYKNSANVVSVDQLLEKFNKNRHREQRKGFTLSGPHLDDFELYLKNIQLRYFGSTGQCRLVALCLKMAQINLLLKQDGKSSDIIALVDDVYGNLDNKIKELFMEVINRTGQIFHTFTDYDKHNQIAGAEVFKIKDGKVFNGQIME
ncbi:MAG: DNA replication and repair protein RecF [Victivallaceae bacterium]|nr:DNA replication and repair protein RecF [Victivallaceae bacterium]